MKKLIPSYKDRVRLHLVERDMSPKQKKIVDDFTAYLGTTAGKNKVADYRRYLLQAYDVIEKPLDKLKPQDIIDFSAVVNMDETRETNTKNCLKYALKRFIKWYYEEDIRMNKEKVLKALNQKFTYVNEKKINKGTLLTEEEIEKILRTADSMKLKAQLILLFETACRPHEIRTAKWNSIDWKNKRINVYASKTKKARTLPLNESIVHLKRWRQEFLFPNVSDDDFIFPSPFNREKPISAFEFGYWIRGVGKKAKLNRPLTAYLIRHSRLTELHNKYGVQGLEHKKFAGHSPSSSMTGVYVAMDDEDMIDSIVKKVYHVEEIEPEKREEFERKISELSGILLRMISGKLTKEDTIKLKKMNPAWGESLVGSVEDESEEAKTYLKQL